MPAVTVYATEADLKKFGWAGVSNDEDIDGEMITDALAGASSMAAGYLDDGNGYPLTLPLMAPVPQALTIRVAWIAAYMLMTDIGYSPQPGQPDILRDRYEDAVRWLEKVAAGSLGMGEVVDSTPPDAPAASTGPLVISGTSRGYSSRGMGSERGPLILFDLPRTRGGFEGD